MHVDHPWDVALSRIVSVPTVLQRWRGYFMSQVAPCWYWKYGLEATFLFSLLLFLCAEAWGLYARTVASHCFVPSTIFPTRGYRGVAPSGPTHALRITGHAFKGGRRLNLPTPKAGDAHTWRRPYLATPIPATPVPGDTHAWWRPRRSTLTFLLGSPWWDPSYVWLWSTPEDGSVHKPPSLELITVLSEKTKASPYRPTWRSLCWWRDT